VWWLALEWMRRREENELNQAFMEELAQLRAEDQRQLERWKWQLAIDQSEAQRRFDVEQTRWKNAVEIIWSEAERRRQAASDAQKRVSAAEQNRAGVAPRANSF
jgi:hypothetical protein